MSEIVDLITQSDTYTKDEIVALLGLTDKEAINRLAVKASAVKEKYVGKITYFRGLIEFSNYCSKNCLYCGIRKGNINVERYKLSRQEIVDAAVFAWKNRYGSIVLQSGELESEAFTDFICGVLEEIKQKTNGQLGITLSCGEQSPEVYQRFFNSGAHRYLLRIETSDRDLYYKIHPEDGMHSFERRLECLSVLRDLGFQVGTGIMVGLPWQTIESIADDLLFIRDFGAHMVGLGPYIEHSQTPLYDARELLIDKIDRFHLTLKAIAILRLMMKDINIAAATALQTLDLMGRERALRFGANIIMPNITPTVYRKDYQLYEDKPCIDEDAEQCKDCLKNRIALIGDTIGYDDWGDSPRFFNSGQTKTP